MTGRTIGKYRILEKLGRGGMGTVYKAVDETLGREVAVKALNPALADTEVMKAFEVEARVLAALNIPEIAAIHEIHRTASDLLLVTELVRGETLDQLLQRSGRLPPERAAYLIAQLLGALAHAHAAGVIHRNLKPSNVMVTELGGLKVLDFGLAPLAASEQMTAVALMAGTPAYMSPERILGNEVDGRADLYSVGVLFYQLLTNTLPFEAAAPTEMVEQQLSATPTPARAHRPDLPEWCEEVLARALAKSPADRFQTAEAFRAELLGSIARAANEQTGVYQVVQPESAVGTSGEIAPSVVASAIPPVVAAARAEAPTTVVPATAPTGAWPSADAPTRFVPAAAAPPAADLAGVAPTARVPIASAPTGTTLIMKRRQFVVASVLLATLALGVVVLAVIVLRRSASVAVAPPPAADASQVPAAAGTSPGPVAAAPPPLEIVDPPIRTSPPVAEPAPRPPAAAVAKPAPQGAKPPVTPAVVAEAAVAPAPLPSSRAVNPAPFTFDAKAVVADGDRHRERDATVLIADGSVTVRQKGDKVLYKLPVAALTVLTYSSSKQPLWNSPDGPAEAMKVESGAFGFLKGGRNWLGLRTNESLLVLRVDDDAVGRVIAGLQDRTGLTVARLIEPKE